MEPFYAVKMRPMVATVPFHIVGHCYRFIDDKIDIISTSASRIAIQTRMETDVNKIAHVLSYERRQLNGIGAQKCAYENPQRA